MSDELQMVLESLKELGEDDSIPRNVRAKLNEMRSILKTDETLSIRLNKALSALEEVSEDTNIQPFTRTQIWGLASMLESINASE
jgi:uncharacterized protein (UPF0147 family)